MDKIKEVMNLKSEDGYIIPSHYCHGKYQTIDIIRDLLTEEQYIGWSTGLIFKYLSRATKDTRERCYTKAKYYLDDLVNVLSKQNPKISDEKLKPKYYKNTSIETIDAIEDQLTEEGLIGFYLGVIIRHIFRAPYKHKLEDYIKAQYYMNKLVEKVSSHVSNS